MSTVPPVDIALPAWERILDAQASALKAQYPSLALPGPVGDRFESAIRLVRDGAVSVDADGVGHVASRTTPALIYTINGAGCPCEDAKRQAPNGRCAHRIAVGLYKQVRKVLEAQRAATVDEKPDDWMAEDTRREEDAQRPAAQAALLPSVQEPIPLPSPRSIRSIIADLSRPLPSACVASKTIKGTKIGFLHWQTVARLLDAYAPGWQGTVRRVDMVGSACVITYRIAIPCAEGLVWREATGQEEEEEFEGYGNPSSNAEAMAFKRAAAKFGVGQWLYTKDNTDKALEQYLAVTSGQTK